MRGTIGLVPEALSKSQLNKLGKRLAAAEVPSDEDLDLLQQMRESYDEARAAVVGRLRDGLGLESSSRIKTVGTLVDKLRREPGDLARIQDIAGVRVVERMDRERQDEIVRGIAELFPDAKVVDRRDKPSHGYRAVHVVVHVEGRPVEVQVRTHLQHAWAELVERLGDTWGRQIRYGQPPDEAEAVEEGWQGIRAQALALVMKLSALIDKFESSFQEPTQEEQQLREITERAIALPLRVFRPSYQWERYKVRRDVDRSRRQLKKMRGIAGGLEAEINDLIATVSAALLDQ